MDAPPSSIAASRLALIAASGVVAAMTVAVLAPHQWPIVASIAATEGLPLAAWLLAAFGFGDALLRFCGTGIPACDALRSARTQAGMPVPPTDRSLSLVTRLALGLGAISLLALLVGVAGLLRQPTAIALILIGDFLAFLRIYTNHNTISKWLAAPVGASWLLLMIAPVFAIMLIAGCVLPGLPWGVDDPAGYDVVAYHLQMPREWFELGRVTALDHNVFSFFPLNLEMHYLLAMNLRGGPWAGMHLAQFMHGSFVALTIAAVYAATRSRGRLAASVAAIVCAGVPWMFMLGGVAYNEGGLMLYMTLAAAWAIRRRWALAGTCAGFAAGCKLTGVPSAIVMVPAIVTIARLSGSRSSIARNLIVFGSLALLAFAPWLIRTAIASGGNPIFPLAMNTLGHGQFDAGQLERFVAAHSPRPDQQSLTGRCTAFWQQVGGDYHFGSIELGGLTLPLWLALIVPAIVLARRDREAWIWLGLIVGNTFVWLFATHLQGRFLVQLVPCIAMLTGCALGHLEGGSPCRLVGTEGTDQRHGVTPSKAFAAIALCTTLASFALSARRPLATLLASPGPLNAAGVSGVAELRQLLPDEVAAAVYDTDRPIVLVGDAKAFLYEIPAARLAYRSVFDVPSTKSFRDAWLGPTVSDDALIIIEPGELSRFAKTYRNLPAIPDAWRDRQQTFVVRASEVPR